MSTRSAYMVKRRLRVAQAEPPSAPSLRLRQADSRGPGYRGVAFIVGVSREGRMIPCPLPPDVLVSCDPGNALSGFWTLRENRVYVLTYADGAQIAAVLVGTNLVLLDDGAARREYDRLQWGGPGRRR